MTASPAPPGPWHRVAALAEFNQASRLLREVEGRSLLLCRLNGRVVAFENSCTHLGMPLHAGRIIAGQIHCPYHSACFDLATGVAVSGPAVHPLRLWPVVEDGPDVLVQIPTVARL